jgi:hypothetical protein
MFNRLINQLNMLNVGEEIMSRRRDADDHCNAILCNGPSWNSFQSPQQVRTTFRTRLVFELGSRKHVTTSLIQIVNCIGYRASSGESSTT